jgi:NAD(P)-dependent dehydrogenase (short-subunit alcohol dehydrogenase family)
MQPRPDHGEESYRGHGRLTGKAALITGADSGIGRAVAIAYAREGADILISYLNEDDDARETALLVEGAGRRALLIPGDVGDEQHCERLVSRAVEEFGRLDILVSNAAFQMSHDSIDEISAAEFDHTFKTNVYALFFLSKAALRHMQPGGSIIATASIQAFTPSPNLLPYAATKGAIVDFVQALAQLVGQRGIRVNAVAPGPVWTPLIPSTMPVEKVKQFGKSTPLGRPGQPAELAPVYVLLASEEGSYISGEVYGVTGGQPLP